MLDIAKLLTEKCIRLVYGWAEEVEFHVSCFFLRKELRADEK
jgi:hypothetical protein